MNALGKVQMEDPSEPVQELQAPRGRVRSRETLEREVSTLERTHERDYHAAVIDSRGDLYAAPPQESTHVSTRSRAPPAWAQVAHGPFIHGSVQGCNVARARPVPGISSRPREVPRVSLARKNHAPLLARVPSGN